jgi:hypothetical protein
VLNQNIKIIDLQNVFEKDQTLFKDVDHLNEKGAKQIVKFIL